MRREDRGSEEENETISFLSRGPVSSSDLCSISSLNSVIPKSREGQYSDLGG